MNRKKSVFCAIIRGIFLVFLSVWFLPGCFSGKPTDSAPSNPVITAEPSSPVASSTEMTTEQTEADRGFISGVGMGFEGTSEDDIGPYLEYNGGELEAPFSICIDGPSDKCIGVFLFIDGVPQPFRTGENAEYRYMQLYYGGTNLRDTLSFIPVAGEKGDVFDLFAFKLHCPFHSVSDPFEPFVFTLSALPTGIRVKFNCDSPESPYPAVSSDCTVKTVDTPSVDISGWTAEMLAEQNEYRGTTLVDNRDATYLYGVTPTSEILMRGEVWGCPDALYSIVFVADNMPIRWMPVVTVENGKTTVVETRFTLPDFDGEVPVYSFLVPRNWLSTCRGILPLAGSTTFLLASKE